MDLKSYVRDVPDFPQPGVLFRDVTPLLQNAKAFNHAVSLFTEQYRDANLDVVVGIESRGFIFAAPIAHELGLSLVPIRKPGKLPAPKMTVEYTLEYGQGHLDIHKDAILPGQRVLIVDDLLATGGTAVASARLIEILGGSIVALAFLVELIGLDGRQSLQGYETTSLIKYS